MRMHDYDPEAAPDHGAVVEWWRESEFGVTHHRATFYLHRVEWRDHPWSASRPTGGGLPFENQWALEQESDSGRWYGQGRSADGWGALVPVLRDALPSEEAAWATHKQRLVQREARLLVNLAEVRRRLAALVAALLLAFPAAAGGVLWG